MPGPGRLSTVLAVAMRCNPEAGHAALMYEIRAPIDISDIDPTGEHIDTEGLDVVLGVHHDLAGAHEEAQWIVKETWAQLLTNGEGHSSFRVHLAIHDTVAGLVASTGDGQ